MAEVLEEAERSGKLKNAKRGPLVFFAYAIAHEGHHRGQIIVHLKNAKMRIDPEMTYAIWEWQKV